MTNEVGVSLVGESAYIELADGRAPAQCPHCGGRLSFGTGPHVIDGHPAGRDRVGVPGLSGSGPAHR
jgi:hypothetical protein